MALPDDVSKFDLTFGHSTNGYTDAKGDVALVGATGKLFPVDAVTGKRINVTHVASGQVIVPQSITVTIDAQGKATVGPLPHTDNPGLSPVGFAYRVEWNIASNKPSPGNKPFAVPAAAGSTVDFDLLDVAEAVPGVLVPVTYGHSAYDLAVIEGFVGTEAEWLASLKGDPGSDATVTPETVAANLPARLSEAELRAAYVAQSQVGAQRLAAQKATPLMAFRAAAAGRTTAPVKIAMIADSIQEGDGVSDYYKRPQSLLGDLLLRHWPIAGMSSQGMQSIGGYQENGSSHPAPMTLTGVNNTDYIRQGFGLPLRSIALLTTAAKWETSAPRQMASFDVVFHKHSGGGVANVLVDGVSVGTVATLSASPQYSVRHHFTVTPGLHTVAVQKDVTATGGSNVRVDQVLTFETADSYAKGFHVIDGAHSGYTTFQMNANHGSDVAALAPDLIIISLAANDPGEPITAAQSKANLLTMISEIRAKLTTNPSFLLMPVWKRNAVTASTWQTYVDVQYEIAAADPNNIAVLDLNLRFPPITSGTPLTVDVNNHRGLYYDNVHPTDKGAALIADTLAAFLAPA